LKQRHYHDGGNSLFQDTIRRTAYVDQKAALRWQGVSGVKKARVAGRDHAGGTPAAWPHVQAMFQSIAPKVDDGVPCCEWVGENAPVHFVKMVHNGIEYGTCSSSAKPTT